MGDAGPTVGASHHTEHAVQPVGEYLALSHRHIVEEDVAHVCVADAGDGQLRSWQVGFDRPGRNGDGESHYERLSDPNFISSIFKGLPKVAEVGNERMGQQERPPTSVSDLVELLADWLPPHAEVVESRFFLDLGQEFDYLVVVVIRPQESDGPWEAWTEPKRPDPPVHGEPVDKGPWGGQAPTL